MYVFFITLYTGIFLVCSSVTQLTIMYYLEWSVCACLTQLYFIWW